MLLQTTMLTALLVLAVSRATMSAEQSSGSPNSLVKPAVTSTWTPDKKNPYGKLFTPTLDLSRQASPTPLAPGVSGKPEIKCGMTLILADPSDPLMAISRPPAGTKFTIRAIDPAICR